MIHEASVNLYLLPPRRDRLDVATLTHADVLSMMLSGALPVGGGAGPVDTVEAAILDHAINKATWTPPSSYWLGLSTTTPTDAAANFTEPVGGSYARKELVTADWASAAGTAPVIVTNVNPITFASATGSWGAVTHAGLFSASSGGSPLWWGALAAGQSINSGGTISFGAGTITLQLGDPTDTY